MDPDLENKPYLGVGVLRLAVWSLASGLGLKV